MRTKERISSIILLCIFAFAFLYSGTFPAVPQIIPRMVSGLGTLLSAGLLVKTFVYSYSEEDKAPLKIEKRTIVLLTAAIAALTLYILLIKVVGYYVTSFAFLIAMAYIVEPKRKWWQYPAVAVGVLLVIYGMFDWFLAVPLPKGLLF